jgi:hypothetical protein
MSVKSFTNLLVAMYVLEPYSVDSVIEQPRLVAVSRRLPTAAARVQTRVWSCGIL